MVILFCEKCGKRIPQNVLDARGIKTADPEKFYYCVECRVDEPAPEPVAASVETGRPQSGARGIRPVSGQMQATKSGQNRVIKKPITTQIPLRDTARLQRSQTPSPVNSEPPSTTKMKLIVGGASVAMILVAILILVFSKPQPKKEVAESNQQKEAPPPPQLKNLAQATTPPPATPRTDTVAATGTDSKAPVAAPELSPKEAYDLRVKQGLVKPAVTAPPPAAGESELVAMTDPDALRAKMLTMNGGWSHESVRHLGELPAPAMAAKTVWAFNSKTLRSDYNSKVSAGTFEGEEATKIEGGDSSRVACYDNMEVNVNRSHIKLRVFQKSVKRMRFSSQTRFGERFNIDFDPPPEGKWGEVNIDISKATCGDVKISNQPIKHTEIQGFRSTDGAYFIVSKFEIVNGGE
jgi:hypothetical protein